MDNLAKSGQANIVHIQTQEHEYELALQQSREVDVSCSFVTYPPFSFMPFPVYSSLIAAVFHNCHQQSTLSFARDNGKPHEPLLSGHCNLAKQPHRHI